MKSLTPDYDPQRDPILLASYDNKWPKMAEDEIKLLKTVLPLNLIIDIQHIGSTAIPGIAAKPIIDLYVGVKDLAAAQNFVKPIENLGYQFWDENPNKEKLFFVKGMPPFGEKRTHHIHIVVHHSPYWSATILFRDYLRNHPEEAMCYQQVKYNLMEQFQYDREAYTAGKNEYVEGVLKKAGFQETFQGR